MKRLLIVSLFLLAACRSTPKTVVEPAAAGESVQVRAERISRWDTGVRMFLEGERDVLRACYEDELRRVEEEALRGGYLNGETVPSLAGRVLLVVPVERDGAVRAPRLEDNTLGNENVDACLLQEAKRWNLPKPPVDDVVEVEVPLTFQLMGT